MKFCQRTGFCVAIIFNVKPLKVIAEAFLEPSRTCAMDIFCENS